MNLDPAQRVHLYTIAIVYIIRGIGVPHARGKLFFPRVNGYGLNRILPRI
jgi:hypothetical protein